MTQLTRDLDEIVILAWATKRSDWWTIGGREPLYIPILRIALRLIIRSGGNRYKPEARLLLAKLEKHNAV